MEKITMYFIHKWIRDAVDWGWRGARGRLVGYSSFRPEKEITISNFFGFYILYYKDKIVYASNSWERYDGKCACIYDILKNHTKLKTPSWDAFSFIGTEHKEFNNTDMLYFTSAILNLIKDNYCVSEYKNYYITVLLQTKNE